jgi:hypothetical protein
MLYNTAMELFFTSTIYNLRPLKKLALNYIVKLIKIS